MIYDNIFFSRLSTLSCELENPIKNFGPEYNEKRIFCRLSVDAELTYRLPGDDNTYQGHCRNLSHSGIQFITEKGLEEGTSLEITIDTKSKKFKPMNALVKIIRVETLGNNEFKVAAKIAEYK